MYGADNVEQHMKV